MQLDPVLQQLEGMGNATVARQTWREGATRQYGVKLGDLRVLAKTIGQDADLARALWNTGNLDARLLATLVSRPKNWTEADLDRMVRELEAAQLAEWFGSYLVKPHPAKESLRIRWMADSHPMAARLGWSLTAERVEKAPEGLDLPSLLTRIEGEMADADPLPQWTMNACLAAIGIAFPEHRERALSIGERLGVYRDYPVAKGCTSPFAPLWIGEMVRRQG